MGKPLRYPKNEIYAYSATSVILTADGVTLDGFHSDDMIKISRVEGRLRAVRGIEKGSVAYIRDNEIYEITATFFRSSFLFRAFLDTIRGQVDLDDGLFNPFILTITDNSSGQTFNFKAVLDGWDELTFSSTTSPITIRFLASEYTYQQITATGRERSTLEVLGGRVAEIVDNVGKTISGIFS